MLVGLAAFDTTLHFSSYLWRIMHDKVLGFLRETMLHENEVESLSVGLATGQIKLTLLQPNEESSWPDHELILTFSGVREVSARSAGKDQARRPEDPKS